MTAEVVVMNQSAVAMAADSAVTISLPNGDKKIYNTANKLFSLSKYQPVGIMVYNSAKLMGVDWEIIIKEYRRNLRDGKFDHLEDYYTDFMRYLNTEDIFSKETKLEFMKSHIQSVINMLASEFSKKIKVATSTNPSLTDDQARDILKESLLELFDAVKDDVIVDCSYEDFIQKYDSAVEEILASDVKNINDEIKEIIKKCIYGTIASPENYNGYTGVVIAGYGDREVFPSLKSFIINGLGDGFSLSRITKSKSISFDNTSAIFPFAQSEMVASFMDGIDPDFNSFISGQIETVFEEVLSIIPLATAQIEDIKSELEKSIRLYKKKYFVSPILNIVESLPKTDLAEMAEALVNLTAFKRHVSPDAETVGGPTDVAVISKADGFIWINRKHYFDAKLNQQFFDKYNLEV